LLKNIPGNQWIISLIFSVSLTSRNKSVQIVFDWRYRWRSAVLSFYHNKCIENVAAEVHLLPLFVSKISF
jgi:hypothetical protein